MNLHHNYIINFQNHIIRCYDQNIINNHTKLKYLNELKIIFDNLTNTKNNNFTSIQENLLYKIGSKIGFYNLYDAQMLIIGNIHHTNNLFIPLKYKIKQIKSTQQFFYKPSKITYINNVKLYIKHNINNNYVIFDGYMLPDPINISSNEYYFNDQYKIINNLLIENKLTKQILNNICNNKTTTTTNYLSIELQTKLLHIQKNNIATNQTNNIGIIKNLFTSDTHNGILEIQVTKNNLEQLTMTGNLGDSMKESVIIAYNYVMNSAKSNMGLHIHILGNNFKDGSSAGLGFAISMLSVILNKKIKHDIGITGEIDLFGNIKAISGMSDKILAGINNNLSTLICPYENINNNTNKIPILWCDHISETFQYVFE